MSTKKGKTEKAYVGMGCFWGPQAFFDDVPGVVATRVGYAGGTKQSPAYHDLGDHTETLEIEFDPKEITYQDLLGRFWQRHDPSLVEKPQYQSALFTSNAEQSTAAKKSLEAEKPNHQREITTRIEPLKDFTEAEAYHQKYYQKNRF
ncbi:peptide-methionine (S)-S-oxide reductase [Patescibacteria group bacterium]|nr:peptide-methionine (S)-S-oxide reductase [Patescibacteria group bacterium]